MKSTVKIQGARQLSAAGMIAWCILASAGHANAAAVDMRFLYSADIGAQLDPEFIDEATAPPVAEVSRRVESEAGSCPAGQLGASSRTREISVMSDGSEVSLDWSDWDMSNCRVAEVSRRVESEAGSCPAGQLGASSRTREVSVMSDGSEVSLDWSDWDMSNCRVAEVSRRVESEAGSCPAGFLGTSNRTREVSVMSDGSEVSLGWSGWDTSSCYVAEVSRRTQTETQSCRYLGFVPSTQIRSQIVIVYSDGSERGLGWTDWGACRAPATQT